MKIVSKVSSSVKQHPSIRGGMKLDQMSLGKALHGELLGVLADADVVSAPVFVGNSFGFAPDDPEDFRYAGDRRRFAYDYGAWRKYQICLNRREYGYKEYLAYHKMPFDLLPNSAGIVRTGRKLDKLSRCFGVNIKEKCEYSLSFRWVNGGRNTKLMIMYNQLLLSIKGKSKPDHKLYWSTARRLMHMKEFQLAAFCQVVPSWPLGGKNGKLNLRRVEKLLNEVSRIVALRGKENISFRRVYIPKDARLGLVEGNVRPLGVPSLAWRVYLRMLNNLLVFSYSNEVHFQHAYQSGKSVVTAWKNILEELERWPSVYEFDLTGFFDNVTHSSIEEVLKELLVPPDQIDELMSLCRSIPVLCAKDLKLEPDRGYRYLSDGRDNPAYNSELHTSDYKNVGVPQGAAISCGLSILVNMYQARRREVNGGEVLCVYYADDGIAFMSRAGLETSVDSAYHGLSRSLKKCKYIKLNGVYVAETLKFVGLELDLRSFEFRSQTRKGNVLALDLEKRLWLHLKSELRSMSWLFVSEWYKCCQIWEEKDPDLAPFPYRPHSPGDAVSRVLSWLPTRGVDVNAPLVDYSWVLNVDLRQSMHERLGESYAPPAFDGDLKSLLWVLGTPRIGLALACMFQGTWDLKVPTIMKPKLGYGSWWSLVGLEFMFSRKNDLKKCLFGMPQWNQGLSLRFPWLVAKDRCMSSLLSGSDSLSLGQPVRRRDALEMSPESLTTFGVDWVLSGGKIKRSSAKYRLVAGK